MPFFHKGYFTKKGIVKNASRKAWKNWLPVCSLSFAAFIFVTTELMPIGLLPQMAADFNKTEASTGLLITFYSWCVALVSLPLTIVLQKIDRRKLLLGIFIAFILGHIAAGLATNFTVLVLARIMIALVHAVFWAITTPLAIRLAPQGYQAQALALIVTGTSLATVLGVPIGTMLGYFLGWRFAFAAIGSAGLLVIIVLALNLPSLPSTNTDNLKTLPVLLRRTTLLKLYMVTFLTVTAHFSAFSYLASLFASIPDFAADWTPFFLFILGISGIFGSVVFSKYADKRAREGLIAAILLLGVVLVLLVPLMHMIPALVVICFVWGMAMAGAGLIFQSMILRVAHDGADIGSSLASSMYNLGIGGGAFVGSMVFEMFGVSFVGAAGAVFILLALVVACSIRSQDLPAFRSSV